MQFSRRLLAAALLSLALAAPSLADRGSDARHHFDEGSKAYDLGDFERAIVEYKAGYEAKPDPVFLFNIAQCYRLARNLEQSLFFYRRFLLRAPEATNRGVVEARIADIERQLAAQKATVEADPQGVVPPPRHGDGSERAAPSGAPPPSSATPAPDEEGATPSASPSAVAAPAAAGTPSAAAAPPAAIVAPPEATTPSEAPHRRWWIWGVVGVAAVAVVGAAVAGGVVASQPSPPTTHFGVTTVAF